MSLSQTEIQQSLAGENDPNITQSRASSPQHSVWVGASAGTGKTKVLTDRVLRLLLPDQDGHAGSEPHQILCLTFTKAAAREMALRVNKILSHWAIADDASLFKTLRDLLGFAPDESVLKTARQLFAKIVDAPGGLQIMTIHAFCQSILGRFPLEAGVSPYFQVMEDHETRDLFQRAKQHVFNTLQTERDSELSQAFYMLAEAVNEDQLGQLIEDCITERRQFLKLWPEDSGDDDFNCMLCEALDINTNDTSQTLLETALDNSQIPHATLLSLGKIAGEVGSAKDEEKAQDIGTFLGASAKDRAAQFLLYKHLFLTKTKNTPHKSFFTKAVIAKMPDAPPIMEQEAERLLELDDRIKRVMTAEFTRNLLMLCRDIVRQYSALKIGQNVMDFDDLILKTLDLLSTKTQAGWVMYKLDNGLNHILVDEAQDTNPEQWDIIKALTQEFFAGDGQKQDNPRQRTAFIVGDEKQSIYSFQRASPEEFDKTRIFFDEKLKNIQKSLEKIELNVSFRSTQSVLDVVDSVFEPEIMKKGLGLNPSNHLSFRTEHQGLVELWPVYKPEDAQEEHDYWAPPITIKNQSTPASNLAKDIAYRIHDLIQSKVYLPSKDRHVQPGDIMILMRTRTKTDFMRHLVKTLKSLGIAVNGADRIRILETLAVQDLMALADFCLLPSDDLALANILKSPLVGLNEDQLFDLAAMRQGTLWDSLKNSAHHEIVSYLKALITHATAYTPFAFFNHALQTPCPADTVSGQRAFTRRLGPDSIDAHHIFVDQTLNAERNNIYNLQGFLHHIRQNDTSQKRDYDENQNAVTIMTAHGSKGLQAPIVFLPDTIRSTRQIPGQSDKRLLWPNQTGLDAPLWSPHKDNDPKLYGEALSLIDQRLDEEYRRLLYVAMTRAEDHLYIAGYQGKKDSLPDSWHSYVRDAFTRMEAKPLDDEGRMRIGEIQYAQDVTGQTPHTQNEASPIPDWATQPVEQENAIIPLMPSRPDEAEPAVISPLKSNDNRRFARGILIHTILQFLPDLPQERRQAALSHYLDTQSGEFDQAARDLVAQEIMTLLDTPEFAPFFSSHSKAEVPITGFLSDGQLVSGQIDRLMIDESRKTIWIIDFKTNRPPPKHEADVPAVYRKQMRTYQDILAQIYPDYTIVSALLWTYTPKMMILNLSSDSSSR